MSEIPSSIKMAFKSAGMSELSFKSGTEKGNHDAHDAHGAIDVDDDGEYCLILKKKCLCCVNTYNCSWGRGAISLYNWAT